jgi:type I restriction enzyme S subunit
MVETTVKKVGYESYKDSEISWLEEIPKHWELKRFKHLFKEKKITHNIELNCGSISFGKVVYKDDEKIPLSTKKSYQVLNKGEFLINPLNLNYDLKSLRIGLSDKDVVVSSGYIIIQNTSEISKNYYKWLLHIFDVAFMKTLGSGVRQTLSFTHIANSELVFPPLEEQTAIAQFLDDKTTKIDEAISIKEQQINLLKERKQILIHKAVTRGLDDTIQLKDSGVEWIGDIPGHWEIKPIKYIKANIKNAFVDGPFGSNLKSEHFIENGEVYVVESGFITTGVFINKKFKTISEKHFKTIIRSECKKADVIIAKIGANYGMAAELPELKKRSVVSGNSLKITLNNEMILNILFVKLLGLAKHLGGFEDIVNASAQPALSLGGLNKLLLPIAPLLEQREISAYIETASKKIERAISLKQQEIAKLKEYKSSLINSVVTGKVKVC